MVLDADRDGIMNAVRKDPAVLQQRDVVGATPMLLLCLYKTPAHQAIFDELRALPVGMERLADQYSAGLPYEGENCLHIAIVNRDLQLCSALIDACPALMHQVFEFLPEMHPFERALLSRSNRSWSQNLHLPSFFFSLCACSGLFCSLNEACGRKFLRQTGRRRRRRGRRRAARILLLRRVCFELRGGHEAGAAGAADARARG